MFPSGVNGVEAIDCISGGDKGFAIALLDARLALGLARVKLARGVNSYLDGTSLERRSWTSGLYRLFGHAC